MSRYLEMAHRPCSPSTTVGVVPLPAILAAVPARSLRAMIAPAGVILRSSASAEAVRQHAVPTGRKTRPVRLPAM